MKHEVTSLNTKKTLAESLKKAMAKKPLSKITVSDIIRDCGINRKTFYYHFKDIYDLLKWVFEQEAIEVAKGFDLLVDYEEALNFIMDYVEKNEHIINCAFDAMGREQMKHFFYDDFFGVVTSIIEAAEKSAGARLDADFKLFLARFYTHALAGMLIEWAGHREIRNREKTIEYLSSILKVSLNSFLENAEELPST